MGPPTGLRLHLVPAVLAAAAMSASIALLTLGLAITHAQSQFDPAATVHARQSAMNAGDADAAATLFAGNAIWVRSAGADYCSRGSPCIGSADILNGLREQVADGICYKPLDETVEGNVVIARDAVRLDSARARGVERIVVVEMAWVGPQGIMALYGALDESDPDTVRNAAIQAGRQAPGEPLPHVDCGT